MNRVVGNGVMWSIGAFQPDAVSLQAINTVLVGAQTSGLEDCQAGRTPACGGALEHSLASAVVGLRFFPRLSNEERDLDSAAGRAWRLLAVDKVAWRDRVGEWLAQRDVPRASGSQSSLTR